MTAHALYGGCHCGSLRIALQLPRPPASYSPRACDCDFCRKHGASYLSDSGGRLRIHLRTADALGRYRQGAGLADFLFCRNCGVLVAVAYAESGRTYATVNTLALEGEPGLAAPTTVSPRTLGGEEKVARWKAVWFSDVEVLADAATAESA